MPELSEGYCLEQFVEAELNCGDIICWWLELILKSKKSSVVAEVWRIRPRLDEREILFEIGDQEFNTQEELLLAIPKLVKQLCLASPISFNGSMA